jgi:DNA (cytosine-5)-methyltransferase 1
MHRQIGNAVPLQVAHALGRQLRKSLFQKWKMQRHDDDNSIDEPQGPRHYLQVREGDDNDDDMDIYE